MKQMKRGDSEPKSVSWSLWSFMSIINCINFKYTTNDYILPLVFLIDSIFCIFIFFYGIHTKKFEFFNSKDWLIFALGFVAFLLEFFFRNHTLSNLIICFAYIFSFVPTIFGVWKKRNSENPFSWWICSFAYLFLIISIYLKNSPIEFFLAPSVLFLLHLVVALLAKKKEIFESPVN